MDITKFCATNDPRSYMHKPMRHDGYLYATNGHIAVRIADDPAIEAGPMPQNLQNGILQKMADYTEDRKWQPVPAIDKVSLRDCAYCNGTGRAKMCPVCDAEFELMTGELLRLLPAVVAAMGGELTRTPDLIDNAKEQA